MRGARMPKLSNFTTAAVYDEVIRKELRGLIWAARCR